MTSGTVPAPSFVLRGLTSAVHSLAFSPDADAQSGFLWVGDYEGKAHLYNVKTKREVKTTTLHAGSVMKMLVDSNDLLLTQGRDGLINMTNVEKSETLSSINTGCQSFCTASFRKLSHLSSSSYIVAHSTDEPSEVGVWDFASSKLIHTLCPVGSQASSDMRRSCGMVMAVELLENDGIPYVATCYENGSLYIFDIRNGKKAFALEKHFAEPILCAAFNFNCSRGICSGAVESISQFQIFYDAGTIELLNSMKIPNRGINSLQLRHDEAIFASAGWDHRTRIFSWKDSKELAILKYHSEGINAVQFSPRGNLLVTGGKDCKVALWNVY